MKRLTITLFILSILVLSGCGILRFAPDEVQKQNAYLLGQTISVANKTAVEQDLPKLTRLTELASNQHKAVEQYIGLPDEPIIADTYEKITGEETEVIAGLAKENASVSSSMAGAVEPMLNLAIAICGIFGGAGAVKVAGVIAGVRDKYTALKEIVVANEIFKEKCPEAKDAFKDAQNMQSAKTQEIVRNIKSDTA